MRHSSIVRAFAIRADKGVAWTWLRAANCSTERGTTATPAPQKHNVKTGGQIPVEIIAEVDRAPSEPGAFSELSRLAIPSGLGDQAPLIERGIDSVRISSAGELPPDPAADGVEDISSDSLGQFSRAAKSSAFWSSIDPRHHASHRPPPPRRRGGSSA